MKRLDIFDLSLPYEEMFFVYNCNCLLEDYHLKENINILPYFQGTVYGVDKVSFDGQIYYLAFLKFNDSVPL